MARLPGGSRGGWSQEAQARLENLLAKPLKGQKGLLALKDKSSSSSPSSSESKSQPVAKKKRAVSASSGSSSDSQSSEKKPTDNEVALNNQLQTAKKDFDTIFSALHHCVNKS